MPPRRKKVSKRANFLGAKAKSTSEKQPNDQEDLQEREFVSSLCHKKTKQQATHISALPTEMLLKIQNYLIPSNGDMSEVEKFGSVCKGFHACARDSLSWKKACFKVWGPESVKFLGKYYKDWRRMYVERPRVKFDGCYISKTTERRCEYESRYGRGCGPYARDFTTVVFFNYFRFFPNGKAMMMRSAHQCQSALALQFWVKFPQPPCSSCTWKLVGDIVTLQLDALEALWNAEESREVDEFSDVGQMSSTQLQIKNINQGWHDRLVTIRVPVNRLMRIGARARANYFSTEKLVYNFRKFDGFAEAAKEYEIY